MAKVTAMRRRIYLLCLVISLAVNGVCIGFYLFNYTRRSVAVFCSLPYVQNGALTERWLTISFYGGEAVLTHSRGLVAGASTHAGSPRLTLSTEEDFEHPGAGPYSFMSGFTVLERRVLGVRGSYQAWWTASGRRVDLQMAIPLWWGILISLPLPLLWARQSRQRRRVARAHLCASCGYDLRGSPPDGDCPECGQVRSKAH